MIILKNQTLYQCSYCGKRLLSRKGCKIHEDDYCKHEDAPPAKKLKELQDNCQHKDVDVIWSYIPGEAVKEPNYYKCLDCGKKL